MLPGDVKSYTIFQFFGSTKWKFIVFYENAKFTSGSCDNHFLRLCEAGINNNNANKLKIASYYFLRSEGGYYSI